MRSKPLADINITPLVDVLLVLLVIIMVTMPAFVKKMPVQLPEVALTGAPSVSRAVHIAVLADGSLTVNDTPVARGNLGKIVNAETSVELAVDQAVTYDLLAKVISDLRQLQPLEISLLVL